MAEMAARVGRKVRKVRYFDYSLVIIILTLVFFGLVMLYSTSAYNGQEKFGDSAYYLKSQGRAVLLGLTAMVLVTAIPYRAWNKIPFLIYGVAFLACLAVPFVGVRLNGQKRWLRFGGITIQPSELAKIAVIIFFAAMLSRMPEQLKSLKNTVKVFFWAVPFIGIVAYSNLSTAIIITGIVVLMMFVASPSYSHYFLALIVVAAAAFAVVWMVKGMEGSGGSYRLERVQVWLDPEKYDKGYQTLQGLYAIGSGGLFGKGLGASMQKLGRVPEAQNDMIFTIICEELGVFGAVCLMLLFMMMLWRFLLISSNAPDLFGSLLVVGIMSHIALQVILNIAVVTNTIPNTGITLPFISFGGTSVTILLAEMGLALSVSRGIPLG